MVNIRFLTAWRFKRKTYVRTGAMNLCSESICIERYMGLRLCIYVRKRFRIDFIVQCNLFMWIFQNWVIINISKTYIFDNDLHISKESIHNNYVLDIIFDDWEYYVFFQNNFIKLVKYKFVNNILGVLIITKKHV